MDQDFAASLTKDLDQLRNSGLAIITACEADQVAHLLPDDRGSVFTNFFLESLQTNLPGVGESVMLQDVYDYVLTKCRDWSLQNNKQQVPRIVVDGIGGAGSIPIAHRFKGLSLTTCQPLTNLMVDHYFLESVIEFSYPREVVNESNPLVKSGLFPFNYGNVIRDAIPETHDKAANAGKMLMEKVAAGLLQFYPADSFKLESSKRIIFPDGKIEWEMEYDSYASRACFTLHLNSSEKSSRVLEYLQKVASWELFRMFLSRKRQISLASIVAYARKKGWDVTRFNPGGLVEVHIKALGKQSNPAVVTFITDERTDLIEQILFKLRTTSEQYGLIALKNEAARLLPE
jgi:hypothetical protein